MNDIKLYGVFVEVQKVIDRVKRVSYYASETKHRYPPTDNLTSQELQSMIKQYLALLMDIEDIQKDYKKIYTKYIKEYE